MILTRFTRTSPASGFLVGGLMALTPLGIPTAMAASTWRAELSAGGGYDDDVLGRPGENSSFPILATGYMNLAPSLWAVWAPGRCSLSGGWSYVLNAYESEEAGAYHDNSGQAGFGFRVAPDVQLRLDGEVEWFHRTEFQDYDFNRQEAAPAAIWQMDDRWSLHGTWRRARIAYPERTTQALGGETQIDRPDELELAVGFDFNERWRLSTMVARLAVDSNSRQYEYGGDRISFGISGDIGRSWAVGGEIARERRNYDRFLYPIQLPSGAVRPGVGREDVSISLAIDLERRIVGNTRLFAGLAYLDYASSLDDYAFDRTRLSGGVSFRFGQPAAAAPGPWDTGIFGSTTPARNPLSPTVGANGVTFRCRAPRATSVHLVGTMNDWLTGAHPMTGPTPDGVWETTLKLDPGLYRYIFHIDTTEWRTPEGAHLYEDDDFGQRNGVLDVAAPVTDGAGGGPSSVTNPR
ncbi:MAG: glycogen-binding domain-containing protein [Candidatus Eisenbacteria bacterium]|nr:glycogen-binding domain-containing protein [Candidatus Eisenbacteria bacterium]